MGIVAGIAPPLAPTRAHLELRRRPAAPAGKRRRAIEKERGQDARQRARLQTFYAGLADKHSAVAHDIQRRIIALGAGR